MNEKTEELLAKVMQKASAAADYTTKKAEKAVEVTKQNFRLCSVNAEIEKLERKIGQMVYRAYQGESMQQSDLDALLAQLDAETARATELRRKLAERKKKKNCPSCGKVCEDDSAFCPVCGSSLRDQA